MFQQTFTQDSFHEMDNWHVIEAHMIIQLRPSLDPIQLGLLTHQGPTKNQDPVQNGLDLTRTKITNRVIQKLSNLGYFLIWINGGICVASKIIFL